MNYGSRNTYYSATDDSPITSMEEFHHAFRNRHWSRILSSLESKSFPSSLCDKNGRTPLSWICSMCEFAGAQFMRPGQNMTKRIFDLLLEQDQVNPARLNKMDDDNWTALTYAVEWRNVYYISQLVGTDKILSSHKMDALLEVPDPETMRNRMFLSGEKEKMFLFEEEEEEDRRDPVIEALIANKDDLTELHHGELPLSNAILRSYQNRYVVKYLCKYFDDLPLLAFTSGGRPCRSPLSIAIEVFDDWAINLLSPKDECLCDQDNYGRTPLYWLFLDKEKKRRNREFYEASLPYEEAEDPYEEARNYNRREIRLDLVKTLIKRVGESHPEIFNVHHTDDDGLTLLSLAVDFGHEAIVETILKYPRIKPDAQNRDRTTPLLRALQQNNENIAILLAKRDKATFKELIRRIDSENDDMEMLHKLLTAEFDLAQEVEEGQPGLHYILENTEEETACEVLKSISGEEPSNKCLDWDQTNADGKRALELAKGKRKLMTYLLSCGFGLNNYKMRKVDWFIKKPGHADEPGLLLTREEKSHKLQFLPKHDLDKYPCCLRVNNSKKSMLVYNENITWKDVLPVGQETHTLEPCPYCNRWWMRYSIQLSWPDEASASNNQRPSLRGIEWIMEPDRKDWVFYRSTLSKVWVPEDCIDFLIEFSKELNLEWQRVCERADADITEHRLRGSSRITRSQMFDQLSKDLIYIGRLRNTILRQVKDTRNQMKEYAETSHMDQQTIEEKCQRLNENLDTMKRDTTDQLNQFEQVITSILQLELARASIDEAAIIRRITLVTFIYLPLMFTASLFGMNVNALKDNPDWRWYILVAGLSFIVTFVFWGYYESIGEGLQRARSVIMDPSALRSKKSDRKLRIGDDDRV